MSGIIVGIDGSVHSRRALEWAISEAAIRHAPLTVVTVPQPAGGYWATAYQQDLDTAEHAAKMAREEVESALDKLSPGSRPPSVTVQAVIGLPGVELVNATQGADMIVLGCRGAGGFKKLLMGSVSVHVTHHAHCPVTVIPCGSD